MSNVDPVAYATGLLVSFGSQAQALALLPTLRANVPDHDDDFWNAVGTALQPVATRAFIHLDPTLPWDVATGPAGKVVEVTAADLAARGRSADVTHYAVATGVWTTAHFTTEGPTLGEHYMLRIASRVLDLQGELG